MKSYRGSFDSTNGYDRITYAVCVPEGRPKAIIQIMHGMCENTGFYREFMVFLAERGFVACAHDAAGHGGSVRNYDGLGFFAEKDGARCLVRDMKRMTNIVKRHFPTLPVILIGHSMGSFILREYLSWYSDGIKAAAILGTSEGFSCSAGLCALSEILCCIGKKNHSKMLLKLGCADFNRRMGIISANWEWLSRSRKTQCIMDRNSFGYTCSGYRDIIRLISDITTDDWAYSLDRNMPFLIMSGLSDPVGRCGKDAARLCRRMKAAGCTDVSVRLYKGARHMLLHETNSRQVFNDILKWTEDVLK